jgi:transposase-like protein
LEERVSKQAVLNTDTFPVYTELGWEYKGHQTVDHNTGEYVNGTAYTNTAEGYFSQFKRSLSGTFHSVSSKHLDRYLAEFDYRYNSRKEKDGNRTKEAIRRVTGRKLSYKDLIGKE